MAGNRTDSRNTAPRAAAGYTGDRAAGRSAPESGKSAASTARRPYSRASRPGEQASVRPGGMARRPAGSSARPRIDDTAAPDSAARRAAPRVPAGRRSGALLLAVLIVAVLASALLRSKTAVLREVRVEGNEALSAQEVAALSGLKLGERMLKVSEEDIARNFQMQNRVKLIRVSIDYPDAVTLYVSERRPRAAVNSAGVILVVDEEGYILERLSAVPEGNLIVVSGLDVSINAQGRRIDSAKGWQMSAMEGILSALEAKSLIGAMSELNLADRYNIYLVSRSGVQIVLGDGENIPAKLVWAKTVLEKLTQEGVMRGVLDVSTGKNAVYADR